MSELCVEAHDLRTTLLSSGICVGLIISYLPQFIRIIKAKTSEGFSPWFLLLGATSSSSGMLNIWILQWPTIRCCRVIRGSSCFEQTLGIAQVTLQWACFAFLFVLYIVYFPTQRKYLQVIPEEQEEEDEETPLVRRDTRIEVIATPEWRLAVTLSIVVLIYLFLFTLLTVASLILLPNSPPHPLLYKYAQFLGITSAFLTFFQYAPQITTTFRSGVVGALSIPMMLIQVPGSAMFVGSLVGRPGVEWSAWLSYAFAGTMQAILLFMCLIFRARQRKLGQDDFGNPLSVAIDEVDRED